ncbi:hypothetical protein ACHAW5_009927, partial [Stephanodiscus triporus]
WRPPLRKIGHVDVVNLSPQIALPRPSSGARRRHIAIANPTPLPPLLDICPPPKQPLPLNAGIPECRHIIVIIPDDDNGGKKRRNVSVTASARNANNEVVAPDLDAYLGSLIVNGDDRHRVDVRRLDVTDAEQIDRLVEEVGSTYGCVDSLFNAGVLGKDTPGPETNIGQIDWGWAMSQMVVNAIGPMALTSKFAPLLRARRGRDAYLRMTGSMESVVVNLSARVAMLKATLNAGVRKSLHKLRRQGAWKLCLYPGMTDTAMSWPFQSWGLRDKGLIFPVDFAVGRMMDVGDRMEEEHSGGFYDWAGQSIPF